MYVPIFSSETRRPLPRVLVRDGHWGVTRVYSKQKKKKIQTSNEDAIQLCTRPCHWSGWESGRLFAFRVRKGWSGTERLVSYVEIKLGRLAGELCSGWVNVAFIVGKLELSVGELILRRGE